MVKKNWQESNVVGVQFANGTSALIAYNKDAVQDPTSNQIVTISSPSNNKSGSVNLGLEALAILYDTNGAKSPNQSTKDLRSINISKLGSACFTEIDGVCIAMQPQVPTPVTKAECEQLKAEGYGITTCNVDNDYWAGAVKLCGGTSKMANDADLVKIANYTYNTNSIAATGTSSGLTFDETKASKIGLPASASFSLWSNEEDSTDNAYGRRFQPTRSTWGNVSRSSSSFRAVCVE